MANFDNIELIAYTAETLASKYPPLTFLLLASPKILMKSWMGERLWSVAEWLDGTN